MNSMILDLEQDFNSSSETLVEEIATFATREDAFNAKFTELVTRRLMSQCAVETEYVRDVVVQHLLSYQEAAEDWMQKTSQLNMFIRGVKESSAERSRYIETLGLVVEAAEEAYLRTLAFRDAMLEITKLDAFPDLKIASQDLANTLNEVIDLVNRVQLAGMKSLQDF